MHDDLVAWARGLRTEANAVRADRRLTDAGKRERLVQLAAKSRERLVLYFDSPARIANLALADQASVRGAADKRLGLDRGLDAGEVAILAALRDAHHPGARPKAAMDLALADVKRGALALPLALLRAPAILDPLSGPLYASKPGEDPLQPGEAVRVSAEREAMRATLLQAVLSYADSALGEAIAETASHDAVIEALRYFGVRALEIECQLSGAISPVQRMREARGAMEGRVPEIDMRLSADESIPDVLPVERMKAARAMSSK